MVTRSECSVWQGGPPRVWKASFLFVAGTRHACRAASVQKHPHIRVNWKDPEACGNNWVCSRPVGRARASGLTPLTLCCQHWITDSNVPRSLGILDAPNTHCVTWSPHLHHLSHFLGSLGPLMEGWRDSRWGWVFFYGGCDWNLWGMVSSLLTGSICKAFPTLMPDTDDALNGRTARYQTVDAPHVSLINVSQRAHVLSFWWTEHLFKITQGHARILKTVFDGNADCRRRNMKQNSWDKGRGEGCNNSARWHRLLCNWAPKLFIHQPPCLSPPSSFSPSPSSAVADQECRLEAARWDAYAWGGWNDLGFCSKFCALIMDSNFRVYTVGPVIIWTKKIIFPAYTTVINLM